MTIPSASSHSAAAMPSRIAEPLTNAAQGSPQLRERFDEFIGQTFFGQMISSMRQTVGKPAYLHGGRAEEIFRGQLDQALAEEMTQRTAGDISGPMYELCMLPRR